MASELYINKYKACRKVGFTLIELLAVMMIIAIMSTVVTTAYVGMMRGSGLREGLNQLRSEVILARQKAITDGNKVNLFFKMNDNLGKVQYYIVQSAGRTTAGTDGSTLRDEFNPELKYIAGGSTVYNMEDGKSTKVSSVGNDGGVAYLNLAQGGVFVGSDVPYGFLLHTEGALPEGFKFLANDNPKVMNMCFYPDGTVTSSTGADPQPISIYEENDESQKTVNLLVSKYGMLSAEEDF